MSDERRRYFRVNDIASLQSTPVSPDELEDRIDDFWNNHHQFSIRNEYNHQLEEHLADFHAIENQMPELARYLSVLQKQIDLVTAKLIPEQDQFPDKPQDINLSAQGISYYSDDPVKLGDLLELYLKLLPSGQQLVTFARVISIEDHDDPKQGKFRVSLDFEHIHDVDQEILIKHVHARQMRELREPDRDKS